MVVPPGRWRGDDGTVVVGVASSATSTSVAFRWTGGVMTDLGTLPGGAHSLAFGVNGDGSVVVGRADNGSGAAQAFYWTATDGMEAFADILTSDGVNLSGWLLTEARSVSADGTVVVGTGFNPSGDHEGWWARLVSPPQREA